VHHLKQKPLKVLCLDFCKLHEQLPFSEPASFTKNIHIFTLKTCLKMRKFSNMWSFYFCSFNEKNVLIGQRCYKIPFHLAQVHILYNLLLLKGHAQTAKHYMSAHFLNQIKRQNNKNRFSGVTALTELLFSTVRSQSNGWVEIVLMS
jgi:hypothetical protein